MSKNDKLHLKIELNQGDKNIAAMLWDSNEEEVKKLENSNYIDIYYKLKIDRYNGRKLEQLILENYIIH